MDVKQLAMVARKLSADVAMNCTLLEVGQGVLPDGRLPEIVRELSNDLTQLVLVVDDLDNLMNYAQEQAEDAYPDDDILF